MSMVGTLAKVPLGVAAAKGVGHVIGHATSTSPTAQATGGVGSLLEQLVPKASGSSSGATASAAGRLDDLIRGLADVASGTAAT